MKGNQVCVQGSLFSCSCYITSTFIFLDALNTGSPMLCYV